MCQFCKAGKSLWVHLVRWSSVSTKVARFQSKWVVPKRNKLQRLKHVTRFLAMTPPLFIKGNGNILLVPVCLCSFVISVMRWRQILLQRIHVVKAKYHFLYWHCKQLNNVVTQVTQMVLIHLVWSFPCQLSNLKIDHLVKLCTVFCSS